MCDYNLAQEIDKTKTTKQKSKQHSERHREKQLFSSIVCVCVSSSFIFFSASAPKGNEIKQSMRKMWCVHDSIFFHSFSLSVCLCIICLLSAAGKSIFRISEMMHAMQHDDRIYHFSFESIYNASAVVVYTFLHSQNIIVVVVLAIIYFAFLHIIFLAFRGEKDPAFARENKTKLWVKN